MSILSKLGFTGTAAALLANPDRKTGLEKSRRDRLTLTFDGIAGDWNVRLDRWSHQGRPDLCAGDDCFRLQWL